MAWADPSRCRQLRESSSSGLWNIDELIELRKELSVWVSPSLKPNYRFSLETFLLRLLREIDCFLPFSQVASLFLDIFSSYIRGEKLTRTASPPTWSKHWACKNGIDFWAQNVKKRMVLTYLIFMGVVHDDEFRHKITGNWVSSQADYMGSDNSLDFTNKRLDKMTQATCFP